MSKENLKLFANGNIKVENCDLEWSGVRFVNW